MTHSLEKITLLTPCSYKLSGTCYCFSAVIATTTEDAVGRKHHFSYQQRCLRSAAWQYLASAAERGPWVTPAPHSVFSATYKVLWGREVFWQCCLLKLHRHPLFWCFLTALNMPRFPSISSKTIGKAELPSKLSVCSVLLWLVSALIPILISSLFSHPQQWIPTAKKSFPASSLRVSTQTSSL